MRTAVIPSEQSMTDAPTHRRTGALLVLALLLAAAIAASAAPNLTNGTTRFTIDTTYNYNLGPTGCAAGFT